MIIGIISAWAVISKSKFRCIGLLCAGEERAELASPVPGAPACGLSPASRPVELTVRGGTEADLGLWGACGAAGCRVRLFSGLVWCELQGKRGSKEGCPGIIIDGILKLIGPKGATWT